MKAGPAVTLVVLALAGPGGQVHEVLDAPAGAARDHVEVSGDALDTAALVELEAARFAGR
jgi:hypothetical protein